MQLNAEVVPVVRVDIAHHEEGWKGQAKDGQHHQAAFLPVPRLQTVASVGMESSPIHLGSILKAAGNTVMLLLLLFASCFAR